MALQAEEDFLCPVCQEVFREPVVLTCSHSFCKDCIQGWWVRKPTKNCPVCKRRSSKGDPPRNLVLKNLCERYLQQRRQNTSEEDVCKLHSEKLRLFCLSDHQPICVVCRDSAAHKDHTFRPIDEVSRDLREELQKSLNPLKETQKLMEEFKRDCDLTLHHIQKQARHTEEQIQNQFVKLHNFLSEQQKVRMQNLRQEEEQKTQRIRDKISAVSREMEALSETIRATEEQLRAPDVSFLFQHKSAVERVQQCPLLEEHQLEPGSLINQAKHLGNLTFNVWTRMKNLVQYTPVVLDPNTAHPTLFLSDDLTELSLGEERKLPKNPERATQDDAMVRASEGFSSGSHSWIVEVGNSDEWELGVMTETYYSLDEQAEFDTDDDGSWCLSFCDGEYAICNTNKKKETFLKLKSRPSKIRLHLECNKHKLTFYDADTNKTLHSFNKLCQKKLFPVFYSEKPLFILPQKIPCLSE